MAADLVSLIRQLARPREEVKSTGEKPHLSVLPGIKAVLFDVYGTLFASGSGDIGLGVADDAGQAMAEALRAEGIAIDSGAALRRQWQDLIRQDHERARDAGVRYPEVEIREIWSALLAHCSCELGVEALERVAVRYENLVNPVWPMPGVEQTLLALRHRGLVLGIISNAQFYTPPLFEALLGRSLEELGFRRELCLWSFARREAKPAAGLFASMGHTLAGEGIATGEVLYVGNDMRNDIAPAAAAGFGTALFAGDARSLRWRKEDALDATPDVILTELRQLPACLT